MWCTNCDLPLSFRFIEHENILGLACSFRLKCFKCNIIYPVKTSTYDILNYNTRYHVNLKAAVAILDGGIGESHLNTVLSALNLPTIHHNLLKRYERVVGPAVESVAKASCHEALKIEKDLTINHERSLRATNKPDEIAPTFSISEGPASKVINVPTTVAPVNCLSNNGFTINDGQSINNNVNVVEPTEKVGIIASYDAGWQKKGSGRSYNSLTGHGTTFGYHSRLCIRYATRNKKCRYCSSGHKKETHDCRLNFEGSSKAMEPDMAVEMFTKNPQFAEENVELKTLIGDEDSSTIANIRRESDRPISKWTDNPA